MSILFDTSPRQDWLASILQRFSSPHSLPASAAEGLEGTIPISGESISTILKANPHIYSPISGWNLDPLVPEAGIQKIVNTILHHFGVSSSRELVRACRPTTLQDITDAQSLPGWYVDVDTEEDEFIVDKLEYVEDIFFEWGAQQGDVDATTRRRRRGVNSPFSPKPFIFASRTRTPTVLHVESEEEGDFNCDDDSMDLGSPVGLRSGRAHPEEYDSNSMS